MTCCERCAGVVRWSYELAGDGDGVEFLIETGRLLDGGRITATVMFCASGLREPR